MDILLLIAVGLALVTFFALIGSYSNHSKVNDWKDRYVGVLDNLNESRGELVHANMKINALSTELTILKNERAAMHKTLRSVERLADELDSVLYDDVSDDEGNS